LGGLVELVVHLGDVGGVEGHFDGLEDGGLDQAEVGVAAR